MAHENGAAKVSRAVFHRVQKAVREGETRFESNCAVDRSSYCVDYILPSMGDSSWSRKTLHTKTTGPCGGHWIRLGFLEV